MNDAPQFDASKTSTYVWASLVISIIGTVIGATGTVVGAFATYQVSVANLKISAQEIEIKGLQRHDALHATKVEIVKQIKDSNVEFVSALLAYLLEPIEKEPGRYSEFRDKILNAMNANADKRPAKLVPIEPPTIQTDTSKGLPYSVQRIQEKFSGAERLIFSNELVSLYQSDNSIRTELVDTLFKSLASGSSPNVKEPYRNNLYVVFTLARIPGGWRGSTAQLNTLKGLAGSFRGDETFARRLKEAIDNYSTS